jgi:hypothetical protein
MRPKGEKGGSGESCETRVVAPGVNNTVTPLSHHDPSRFRPACLVTLSGKIHECGLISGTSFDVLVYGSDPVDMYTLAFIYGQHGVYVRHARSNMHDPVKVTLCAYLCASLPPFQVSLDRHDKQNIHDVSQTSRSPSVAHHHHHQHEFRNSQKK